MTKVRKTKITIYVLWLVTTVCAFVGGFSIPHWYCIPILIVGAICLGIKIYIERKNPYLKYM